MYTEIGAIGSSSELRLDPALFSGSESAADESMPILADHKETPPSFWTRATQPLSNKQTTLRPDDRQGGLEALRRAVAQSKK
jgi:hypothetical protein